LHESIVGIEEDAKLVVFIDVDANGEMAESARPDNTNDRRGVVVGIIIEIRPYVLHVDGVIGRDPLAPQHARDVLKRGDARGVRVAVGKLGS
jgi:hypothetical protein